MRENEIDILLERFYAGESTTEEERILADFFNGTEIPEKYIAEKALFNYYHDTLVIPAPSSVLAEKIISTLEAGRKTAIRTIIIRLSGIAAGIMILMGSWFYLTKYSHSDTFDDPEIAYAETMKVLYAVSSKMNEGLAALEPVSGVNIVNADGFRVLAKSKETLRENLDYLDHLDRIITGMNNMKENQ